MPIDRVVLVETSEPGNLGGAIRAVANFGVGRLDLVRVGPDPDHSEVRRRSCGGERHLEIRQWRRLADATADVTTVVGTGSGRGRQVPATGPSSSVLDRIRERGRGPTAVVFGNETSGLSRDDLDRCDLVLRLPTTPGFPVMNLAQAVAATLALIATEEPVDGAPEIRPPAPAGEVQGLMEHLDRALTSIGFLDPQNPDRILRKIRQLLARAAVRSDEVTILRGICRQMEWAASHRPTRRFASPVESDPDT